MAKVTTTLILIMLVVIGVIVFQKKGIPQPSLNPDPSPVPTASEPVPFYPDLEGKG